MSLFSPPPDQIYVAVDANGIYKLGCSHYPERRIYELGYGRPFRLVRVWRRPLQDAMRVEMMCHAMLAKYRAEPPKRELYKTSLRRIAATVRDAYAMAAREDYSVLKKGSAFALR